MTQGIVTAIIGIALIAIIAVSYVRTRNLSDDESAGLSIRKTMEEAGEYFGAPSKSAQAKLADEFDLAPARMLAQMGAHGKLGEKGKGGR